MGWAKRDLHSSLKAFLDERKAFEILNHEERREMNKVQKFIKSEVTEINDTV
jgi:hypothetical protein